ncbi:MAG: hypothetical protein CBB90_12675 [Gammaproteobacteria bacterium TMED30]|nr:MAG: hypothetical protein CBB90_12675 [Gammaproteobacteria bacterium TMED30]
MLMPSARQTKRIMEKSLPLVAICVFLARTRSVEQHGPCCASNDAVKGRLMETKLDRSAIC